MRYAKSVSDVFSYDIPVLEKTLISNGLPIVAIHTGNSALIFDFSRVLTSGEKTTLNSTFSSYTPINYTWVQNGKQMQAKCSCAEDVDRITARRIRDFIGGHSSSDEQLKKLRRSVWALHVKANQGSFSQQDIDAATTVINTMLFEENIIEAIKIEGVNFKASKGW